LIALLCAGGSLITTTVAEFWVAAEFWVSAGRVVIRAMHNDIASLSTGSSLLVDGICPYVGPAIVFESNWDVPEFYCFSTAIVRCVRMW
jgi:hypothetical protein